MEKNWAHPVDQCWLQAFQFSVHLIGLLSILLRYNDFSGIQKAMVYQTGSSPPDSGHDLSLVHVWLWEMLWDSQASHWACCHWLLYKIHFLSPITVWSRNGSLLLHRIREEDTSEQMFLGLWSVREAPAYRGFAPLQFAPEAGWHRMVGIEFFGSFLCGCTRSSFGKLVSWLLLTFDGRPLCPSSRLSSPLQNLNHHCSVCSLVVPGPDASLKLQVLALQPILNSNKKITWIFD